MTSPNPVLTRPATIPATSASSASSAGAAAGPAHTPLGPPRVRVRELSVRYAPDAPFVLDRVDL